MKNKVNPWIVSLMSLSLVGVAPTPVEASEIEEPSDEFSLTVFHTNDMHASINDFGKIAHYLKTERATVDHSLYLDAGDIFSGNPVVDLMDGIPMIELLNDLKLDLLTIGNHEFDYGQDVFQDRRNESNFEWISANTKVVDSSIPISQTKPYDLFNFGDVTVGVFGLTEAPPATAPSGLVGLEFNPYILTAEQYSNLRDEVDILIALTHIGVAEDRRLAEAVDYFDVIIGGHSHTTLQAPEVVNGTPIVSSGSNARNIGVLNIVLNTETGDVSVDGRLQPVSELTEVDPAVQAKIDQYNAETEELLNVVVGKTKNELNRDARWEMDVSIGNLITDSLRNFADTDIAFTNNGGIRASVAAGDITARDIFTVDPFGNVVTIIEMTGHEIKDILAYSFHRAVEQYGPQIDLQTSGLNYTIYTKPDGRYYDSDLFINGAPMDLDQTYTIATNNFIVSGGDGYDFSSARIVQADQGQVTNALIQYIQEVTARDGGVNYEATEGRINTVALTYADIMTPILSTDEMTFDLKTDTAILPGAETFIENLSDLPEETVVTYVNDAEIDLTGATTDRQTLNLLVTYPDGSTDSLSVAVSILPLIADETNDDTQDGEDNKEVDNKDERTKDKGTGTPVEKDTNDSKEEVEGTLPAAGETTPFATIGVILSITGASILTITKFKKKEEVR